MAIPWLIGAAAVWAGKKVYDSYEEDERCERAERRARADRREREDEANKQREAAIKKEQKRDKQEQQQRLKSFADSQAEVILDKYKITSLTSESLAANAISNPEQATAELTEHYIASKKCNDLEKAVLAIEKALDESAELEQIIKGF